MDAGELIAKYRIQLRRLMFQRFIPMDAWDDVLQNIAIKIHLAIQRGHLKPEVEPFNYVYTTAINCINGWLRHKLKRSNINFKMDPWVNTVFTHHIEGAIDAARIMGIVRSLPSKQRALVESIIEGYTIPEHAATQEEDRVKVWRRWKVTEQTLRRKLAA